MEEKNLSPLAISQELWATRRRYQDATVLQSDSPKGELSVRSSAVAVALMT